MLDTLKPNEKMFLQSRNYVLKSQIFGRNADEKTEIDQSKFIPSMYN